MEQPNNLRTKKPRIRLSPHALEDGPINSAQAHYQAASERMAFHQGELEKAREEIKQRIAFHQGELEKAREEIKDARRELQNHGSAYIDSLLIVGDDCLKAMLPFCDWKTLLHFGGTCKKLFQLTEMEWEFRFQKIDKSSISGSTWLVKNEEGEIDYDSTNSFCKLHKVRFEKAAAYAKKLEPKVQDHIVVYNGEPTCSGCSEFPSHTNVKCLRATKHYGFFLRIFSPYVEDKSSEADDTSLLWQGFVDTKVIFKRENCVKVLLTGFDSNNILPHLKDFLWWLHLWIKAPSGNLTEDEQETFLKNEYYQMKEKAVRNIGFILVALNPCDEMVSLVHATSEFDCDPEDVAEVFFKPMLQEIHESSFFAETCVSVGLDIETKNLFMTLHSN